MTTPDLSSMSSMMRDMLASPLASNLLASIGGGMNGSGVGTNETQVDPNKISSDAGTRQLFAAIERNDLASVRRSIDGGVDVLAIRRGSMAWNGMNNPATFTAVGLACHLGRLEALQILCDNGADPSLCTRNSHGMSPMMLSAVGGHLDVMKWLHVTHGVHTHIGSIDNHWMTPLCEAVENNNVEMCCWLLENGAQDGLWLQTKMEGHTPFFVAIKKGQQNLVEILHEYNGTRSQVNDIDKNGLTPMHLARNASVLQWVYDHGGKRYLNFGASESSTEMARARQGRQMLENIARGLKGGSSDPRASDLFNKSRALLEHRGTTPLAFARLIMKSASPNKAELVNDCAEKIALLDSWGADEVEPRFSALDMSMMATTSLPSRKDRLKHLKRAIGRGANILFEYGCNNCHLLFMAAATGCIDIFDFIYEQPGGASLVTKAVAEGHTPLTIAVQYGHLKSVEWLVEHGANVHRRNHGGSCPVDIAVKGGHTETLQYLVEQAGCKGDLFSDSAHVSPMQIALAAGNKRMLNLLRYRWGVSLQDPDGGAPCPSLSRNVVQELASSASAKETAEKILQTPIPGTFGLHNNARTPGGKHTRTVDGICDAHRHAYKRICAFCGEEQGPAEKLPNPKPGDRARLQGLVSCPELNGKEVVLIRKGRKKKKKSSRWIVTQLKGGPRKELSIKHSNLTVGVKRLQRCAGCPSYYCSVVCQRKDWKIGGHKQKCTFYRKHGEFPDDASFGTGSATVHVAAVGASGSLPPDVAEILKICRPVDISSMGAEELSTLIIENGLEVADCASDVAALRMRAAEAEVLLQATVNKLVCAAFCADFDNAYKILGFDKRESDWDSPTRFQLRLVNGRYDPECDGASRVLPIAKGCTPLEAAQKSVERGLDCNIFCAQQTVDMLCANGAIRRTAAVSIAE
jgi:ankyrin repeat protein